MASPMCAPDWIRGSASYLNEPTALGLAELAAGLPNQASEIPLWLAVAVLLTVAVALLGLATTHLRSRSVSRGPARRTPREMILQRPATMV